MTKYNILLIGHTGCGKTAVAKVLTGRLGHTFCDTDMLIEQHTGMAVAKIFEQEGERYFRGRETQLLRQLVERDGLVIATGGGMVVDPQNRELMRQCGLVVYLQTARHIRLARIGDGLGRPLLYGKSRSEIVETVRQMEDERSPLYEKVADFTVDHATDADDTADRITQKIKQYEKDPHRSLPPK